MSTKRPRSPSPPAVRPTRSSKRNKPVPVDDFHEFTHDLQQVVRRMRPTGGRRYNQAAILAIDFSVSDIPSVKPLRNELLNLLENTYNWKVEKYSIDCGVRYREEALFKLNNAVNAFILRHGSSSEARSLLTFYFSGHGFADEQQNLNLCGSFVHAEGQKSRPKSPWLPWKGVITKNLPGPTSNNHRLVIMDCCAAGLANLDEGDIEVLGASAWESEAAATPQSSFTRAIIDELKSINGMSITITQLVSALHSQRTVMNGASTPVHKRASADLEPAVIHRIEKTPSPLRQVSAVPRFSHVLITVKVAKENSVPDVKQWANWLKTNLPPYVGEIDITAKWKTGSALVVVVMPIELWLDLPARPGYGFMEYHRAWDVQAARQRLETAAESRQQEQRLPTMRSGNIEPPPGSSSAGTK